MEHLVYKHAFSAQCVIIGVLLSLGTSFSKMLSPLAILSMEKTIVVMVISELNQLLKVFPETGLEKS